MEDNLGAAPRRPTHGFRIAPPFMADHDTEGNRPCLENTAFGTRRIDAFLGSIDLDFVLKPGDASVTIDDERRGQQGAIDQAFRAEHNRDPCSRGGSRKRRPRALKERGIGRRYGLSRASITGNEAFRETDEAGALYRGLNDGLLRQRYRLLRGLGEADVGECDAEHFSLVPLPRAFDLIL